MDTLRHAPFLQVISFFGANNTLINGQVVYVLNLGRLPDSRFDTLIGLAPQKPLFGKSWVCSLGLFEAEEATKEPL